MKNLLDKTLYKWIDLFCNHRHNLLLVYCVVMLFLMIGLVSDSGAQYLPYLLVYTAVFLITYFLNEKFLKQSLSLQKIISGFISKVEINKVEIFSMSLFVVTVFFMTAHFIYLGGVPTIRAWFSHDSFEIYSIRKSVTADSNALMNYLSSFTLRAILPFLVLYFYQKSNWKIFIFVFLISLFYCMAFVAKSYLVTALIPLLIFSFLKKKYFHVVAFAVLIFGGLNLLVFISNPALRGGDVYQATVQGIIEPSSNELGKSVTGLADRTFFLPGIIVSEWFKVIPSEKPFLKGSGYHIISDLKGTEFRDYSAELYPVIFPDYAKRGYAGSVNVASFMYDYANFGWIGIIYSAIILALIFVFVNLIFDENNFIKLCINLFYVLVLSSSSFLTLAFSGGWGLMILLFLFFRKDFFQEIKTSSIA